MANLRHFALPDLGEGLTEGEILKWLVAPGDTVRLNQPIVEVETAKAAVEVPSPYAGVVTTLHHGVGETVDVGAPIITVDTEPDGAGAAPGVAALEHDAPEEAAVEPGLIGGPAPGGRTSVLVGYGPKSVTAKRRPRRAPSGVENVAAEPPPPPARVSAAAVGERAAMVAGQVAVLAKPPVRKLARDAGVDLRSLVGSGPGGAITRADVTAAIGATATVGTVTASPTDALAYAPSPAPTVEMLPQVDPATREQRIPIKGVRKVMAKAMVGSAFSAPHVTIWATADMTPTMEFLEHLKGRPEFAGVRVSPLLMAARALLVALRRHPMVNSSWDDDAQEIVVKDYVNLGIAAATPRGLVVPNIKDAGRLALPGLATALNALADTARAGRTSTEDMSRGTITITNVGFLGMDTGTPILNPGESAILCFGVVRPTPWVHQGSITVRQITQLALSFDHRHIDGQLGAGFLADIATLLADPAQFAVWG